MTGKKPATKPKGTKRAIGKARAARASSAAVGSPKRSTGRGPSASAAKLKGTLGGSWQNHPSTGKIDHHGVRPTSKLGIIISQLQQKGGATIEAMSKATGWQSHSARGALSGTIKKKLGLDVQSETTDGIRHYRIVD